MEIEAFEPSDYGEPGGWLLSDWASIEELLAFREHQHITDPDRRLLFVLDDRHQADYTSSHATNTHRLDWPDESTMSAEELHQHEHEGKMSPQRRAATVVANLRAAAEEADLAGNASTLLPIDAEEIGLVDLYSHPEQVFETPLTCLTIPADGPSAAIAAKPNGYFTGDLTPAENYLLAEQLHDQFGYEILGLGSYLAAYVSAEPFDLDQITSVVSSVRGLYANLTDDRAAAWAEAAADRRWFLLHYRGS